MKKIKCFLFIILATSYTLFGQCGTPPSTWHKRLNNNSMHKWWVIIDDLNQSSFYSNISVPITNNSEKITICNDAALFASDKWNTFLGTTNIRFQKANSANESNFIIHFYNYGSNETSGTSPTLNGGVEEGIDINIFTGIKLTRNTSIVSLEYRDIYAILLHEFGHILLDGGHTTLESNSVMHTNPLSRDFNTCDEERIRSILDPHKLVTVKNSFGAGLMKIDSNPVINIPASGQILSNWRETTFPHSFTAIDGQKPSTYFQRFQNWAYPGGSGNNLTVSCPLPTTSNPSYTANFLSEFNITFANNHAGGETGGQIKVDDVSYNLPTGIFYKLENKTIKGEAISHEINGIGFYFDHWSEQGGTTYVYNFSQTTNKNYIAYFKGKPTNTFRNQSFNSGANGTPIIIYWNQHPNTNVTKYGIYRKTKFGSEQLIKTVNRTSASSYSYTDPEYVHTNNTSSTNLLSYDVRAFYGPDGIYSDSDWRTLYGEIVFKQNEEEVKLDIAKENYEYGISNYPNPYNPTTTISYQIKEIGNVTITVYDVLGREVKELVNETKQPGIYTINFDGTHLSSGIYFYTMRVNEFITSKKMLLTK